MEIAGPLALIFFFSPLHAQHTIFACSFAFDGIEQKKNEERIRWKEIIDFSWFFVYSTLCLAVASGYIATLFFANFNGMPNEMAKYT